MGGNTARSGSAGESISHFNAVRMRVVGTGNLKMSLSSLDDINTQTLVPFVMNSATNREPTRLSNFIEQRASLKVETTEINEYFRINRIIIFSKPLWANFPG